MNVSFVGLIKAYLAFYGLFISLISLYNKKISKSGGKFFPFFVFLLTAVQ